MTGRSNAVPSAVGGWKQETIIGEQNGKFINYTISIQLPNPTSSVTVFVAGTILTPENETSNLFCYINDGQGRSSWGGGADYGFVNESRIGNLQTITFRQSGGTGYISVRYSVF